MSSKAILVNYCRRKPDGSLEYEVAEHRFIDWYDFADWLKQETMERGPVLINTWRYI